MACEAEYQAMIDAGATVILKAVAAGAADAALVGAQITSAQAHAELTAAVVAYGLASGEYDACLIANPAPPGGDPPPPAP